MQMDHRFRELTLSEREALIMALPCFAMLSKKEAVELAGLMHLKEYKPQEIIVIEDAIVDSVFIITAGQVEVTKQSLKKNKLTRKLKATQVPVAILTAGDAIGLNDTGFFSTTGKRTATITAMDYVQALYLDLKSLHAFLSHYPHLKPAMQQSAAHLLKMKLIKQCLAFNRVSYDRLNWLAEKVEELSVPQGAIIFQQGDKGDRCYLIRSGEVDVSSTDEQGNVHSLAVLKSPTLFGEATLVTHSPRNATARAVLDTQLLVIRNEYLSELLETDNNVADTFMTLMIDRSQPLKNPSITTHERKTADGQEVVILKNPDTGSYFKLSKEGWFIWQQMNGNQTVQEITLALADQYGIFEPDIVVALISRLARAGYVSQVNTGITETTTSQKQPRWIRMMAKARSVLEARVAVGDADRFLTKAYRQWFRFLFTRFGKWILGILAILGIASFAFHTPQIMSTFQSLPKTWVLLLLLIPLTIFSVVLHEFGHAFTTKAYGQEVHYMGVGWYWLGPVAFTDTSDMWLSTKWPRIFVNLAGIYTDVIDAGIAALLIGIISNPYIQAMLWLFALFTYINAFRMLSPLQELDGYYILMDLLDRPRLRQSAVVWLIKDFPKAIRHPSLFKKNKPEMWYWIACIVFLVLVSILTVLVQGFLFKMLGIHSSNIFVALALPFLVIIISCLGILAELRGQK